jgi:serine-type D-Ala-D-Ala carboxypeptidase/endopeptidase (penicillin-binding protein 4)
MRMDDLMMFRRGLFLLMGWWACCLAPGARALDDAPRSLPPQVTQRLTAAGVPLSSFGVYAKPVDGEAAAVMASVNAEHPFVMASTTKLVTSVAALELLGPAYEWRTRAFATAPVRAGRLQGDLVIVGGSAGLTPGELERWFRQMRSEGLTSIAGNIVMEHVAFLHESNEWRETVEVRAEPEPEPVPTPVAAQMRRGAPGSLVVTVSPSKGPRAIVTVNPRPAGASIVNDVSMGEGCVAFAVWETPDEGGPPQLAVRGSWDPSCGKRDVAAVRAPASVKLVQDAPQQPMPGLRLPAVTAPAPTLPAAPQIVAGLWREAGGRIAGRVIETPRWSGSERLRSQAPWSSQIAVPLAEVLREMNKTSNNLAARGLLLSLAEGGSMMKKVGFGSGEAARLRDAQARVHEWLRSQGFADDDIRVDVGSGQSRAERGKPRAMVQLLTKAWRGASAKPLVDSLPIAGVDGTLAHRMLKGPATGQAFLKTGTLSDTRALAGYVKGKSGQVYAVAMMVNHPRAAMVTPALDAFIEWLAAHG